MSIQSLSSPLMSILASMPTELQQTLFPGAGDLPKRYFKQRPADDGTFILPLKQSFMKDPRLSPGTKVMLSLLAGWAGHGHKLQLTKARIGKHIDRSVRQVYRYIQEAVREGYLYYGRTKDRLGYITGLWIKLNLDIIRAPKKQKQSNKPRNRARPHVSETNETILNNYKDDDELEDRLGRLRSQIF